MLNDMPLIALLGNPISDSEKDTLVEIFSHCHFLNSFSVASASANANGTISLDQTLISNACFNSLAEMAGVWKVLVSFVLIFRK
jgi:hypothetical protein